MIKNKAFLEGARWPWFYKALALLEFIAKILINRLGVGTHIDLGTEEVETARPLELEAYLMSCRPVRRTCLKNQKG